MKNQIRNRAKAYRAALTTEEIIQNSRAIADRLFDSPEYKNAANIFCYVHTRTEVCTDVIMKRVWLDGKKLFVPLVTGKDMIFIRIGSEEELAIGSFGILEPVYDENNVSVPGRSDVILVPGLAFDETRARIGYGGGFYDRYFAVHPEGIRIGLAFSGQIVENTEPEPFDERMDRIITENAIL